MPRWKLLRITPSNPNRGFNGTVNSFSDCSSVWLRIAFVRSNCGEMRFLMLERRLWDRCNDHRQACLYLAPFVLKGLVETHLPEVDFKPSSIAKYGSKLIEAFVGYCG